MAATIQAATDRLTMLQSANKLGISKTQIKRLVDQGIFTVQRDGLGATCQKLLMVDELESYIEANARGGFNAACAAVRQLRKREGRI